MNKTRNLGGSASETSRIQAMTQQWRKGSLRRIGVVGLVFAIAVWVWQLPHFLAGNSDVWPQYSTAFYDMLFYTAWGAIVLLLLTIFTRTVSVRTLLAFWLFGVFAVHGLVIAIGTPFRATLGVDGVGIWVAPIVETLIVALVILVFYLLATYHRTGHPTVSDGLLVGFATGAGLGFHEDMTYSRLVPIGPGAEYASVGNVGQDIWWSYIFPLIGWQAFYNIRQFGNGVAGNFTLYHAGWGTLLGIGIGFAYVHRHSILAWLVALLTITVTYFEHMSGNWATTNALEPAPIVGTLFQAGDMYGVSELAVYILLTAIAGAILTDFVVFHHIGGRFTGFPSVRSSILSTVVHLKGSPVTGSLGYGVIRQFSSLEEYARLRRALMIGLYRAEKTGGDSETFRSALAALYEKGRQAKIIGSVGIGLIVAITVIEFALLTEVNLPVESVKPVTTCASCAPPNRFMGLVPSVLGSAFALIAVLAEVRSSTVVSTRSNDFASADNGTVDSVENIANYVEATPISDALSPLGQLIDTFEQFVERTGLAKVTEKVGKVLRRTSRWTGPIGKVVDLFNIFEAYRTDGFAVGRNTLRAGGAIVGGMVGAAAGAHVGMYAGAVLVGGIGVVAGGPIMGLVGLAIGAGLGLLGGALAGGAAGSYAGEWLSEKFADMSGY